MAIIPFSNGDFFTVDDDYYELFTYRKWQPSNNFYPHVYRQENIDGAMKVVMAADIIMGTVRGQGVNIYYWNGNPHDLRIDNIRLYNNEMFIYYRKYLWRVDYFAVTPGARRTKPIFDIIWPHDGDVYRAVHDHLVSGEPFVPLSIEELYERGIAARNEELAQR